MAGVDKIVVFLFYYTFYLVPACVGGIAGCHMFVLHTVSLLNSLISSKYS